MNSPLYFEIQVEDIKRAMHFYQEVFNWTFEKWEEAPIEYYYIKTEGITGGMLERPAQVPTAQGGTNAAIISMEVKDFDTTAEKILSLDGIVALPKFPIPGKCWQGYFIDNEGNTFGIFEPNEKAGL